MDTKTLNEKYAKIIERIGPCPMSQNDVVEAMAEGDCMCLCLQISRSEATVMDPSRLLIKGIVPTFMTLESFMDSSIFNLKKNTDASGGFDYKNEGSLALGLGRESVSGIFPLYLFKEHWEIAKRKMQAAYGFMCTLDPMGYAPAQYFVVPYLVMLQAFKQLLEEDS